MFLKRWLILILLLPLCVTAQETYGFEALEDWSADGVSESAVAEMGDVLMHLRENPININDTAAVASLPFMTPFQHRALRNYILLYGQLVSLRELAFVPGFDSTTVALIEPLVKVEPYVDDKSFKPWQGHHNIVAGTGGTIERAQGYENGNYAGDNMRALMCYTYNYRGRLSVRLALDKDPGEAWGKDNYYNYHIMLNDIGRLKNIVVGRYNLQFGQGLTMWTGLAPFNIAGVSPMRFGQGIKPSGAFYEDNYLEGAAATVNIGWGFNTTLFASRVEGVDLLGGHLGYRKGNFFGGVTFAYSNRDDSVTLRDYVYNSHYFRGDRIANVGVDAMWQWRRITLYGEAALACDSGTVAMVAGALVQADSRNRFGISVRHFDEAYHNPYAQPFAVGSAQNESGVALDAISRLPFRIDATLSLDLHKFSAPRYGAYMPSSGQWLRVRLDRHFGKYINFTLRYAYRYKERNIPNIDSVLYLNENTLRQQVQAELRSTLGQWQLSSRGVACRFDSEKGTPQFGWAVGVAARYTHRRIQTTLSAAWHNVDGYYARIYFSESNLQYVWTMPALNGRGMRASAVIRYRLSDCVMVGAKYAVSLMPGVEAIGSGDSMTKGDHRQTWHVQLRLKL